MTMVQQYIDEGIGKLGNIQLSEGEFKALALTSKGYNRQETSSMLNISEGTFRNKRTHTLQKIGVYTLTQSLILGNRLGWFEPEKTKPLIGTVNFEESLDHAISNYNSHPEELQHLTPLQTEIWMRLLSGYSCVEISYIHYLDNKYVRNSASDLYKKMEIRNCLQAVILGIELGLEEDSEHMKFMNRNHYGETEIPLHPILSEVLAREQSHHISMPKFKYKT